jgi:hypothetical protein
MTSRAVGLILTLAFGLLSASLADAQPPLHVPRVGFLDPDRHGVGRRSGGARVRGQPGAARWQYHGADRPTPRVTRENAGCAQGDPTLAFPRRRPLGSGWPPCLTERARGSRWGLGGAAADPGGAQSRGVPACVSDGR